MHTHVVDENGTDLGALKHDLFDDVNVIFSEQKVTPEVLNWLYNVADVTVNLASNEGYGMATAESLMAGTPVIATITGGMQDQLGVNVDEDYMSIGTWQDHIAKDDYSKISPWAYAIVPRTRTLTGSPPTPYIYDDRINWMDAVTAFHYWYGQTREERKNNGLKGRDFLIKNGHSVKEMISRFKTSLKTVFKNWKPRERVKIIGA
jgi:hypothetical protein